MSRTATLLALAAVATFGVAMIDSTPASARGGVHAPSRISVAPRVAPRISIAVRPIRPGIIVHPRHPRPHWHVHYRHPRIWYAPRPVLYGAVAPVVTSSRCTCLTKTYTAEGVVVFKDVCTNEMAMNPPPGCADRPAAGPELPATAQARKLRSVASRVSELRPCAGVLLWLLSRASTRALLSMSCARRSRNASASA